MPHKRQSFPHAIFPLNSMGCLLSSARGFFLKFLRHLWFACYGYKNTLRFLIRFLHMPHFNTLGTVLGQSFFSETRLGCGTFMRWHGGMKLWVHKAAHLRRQTVQKWNLVKNVVEAQACSVLKIDGGSSQWSALSWVRSWCKIRWLLLNSETVHTKGFRIHASHYSRICGSVHWIIHDVTLYKFNKTLWLFGLISSTM